VGHSPQAGAAALTATCRQAILRFRFNSLHASIIGDTLPAVMTAHFPGAEWRLDKQLWVARFANDSELWFGGLDESDRVEKVLGQGHAGLYFNECSQIPWSSRQVAVTRLAQEGRWRAATGDLRRQPAVPPFLAPQHLCRPHRS
jgi:hypothetical protein